MMDWHLTWQDPVAIGLAVLCLLFVAWFRRRARRSSACGGCGQKPSPPTQIVPAETLRLGKRD